MTASNRTLARLERILVMVPWLLERPGVTVDEACARFAITRDELAGDLDVLGYCGLPGYGGGDLIEAWIVGDRVSVRMADFFSRPLRLTVAEAVGLLLAGRALAQVPGLPESSDLQGAISKLERVLGADARVDLDLRSPGDELLGPLREAVAARRVVGLRYRSARGQTTQRDVEPEAVVGAGGAWYLQAWCRLATAPRDFRLDRIVHMVVREDVFFPRPAAGPRPPGYRPSADAVRVTLDLAPGAWWVAEWLVTDDVTALDGVHRLTVRTSDLSSMARLVLRLGGQVTAVSPPALCDRVRELALRTLRHYEPAAD